MCWLCEHPGSTWLDYLDHMQDMIASATVRAATSWVRIFGT